MPSRVFSCMLGAVALAVAALAFGGQALAEPFYQGPKKCQDCHREEFKTWEGTKHFKSFREAHKNEKAKKIAAAVGGSKNMKKNAVCTICHYTRVQKDAAAKARAKAGPSCESCHGASSDWLDVHNSFGGPNVKRADETPEHKSERHDKARAAGMIWSSMRYDIAKNCMSCHGLARDDLDADSLGKMLAAEHPLNPEFEFVRYSQGSVRHRFYPPDVTANAEMTKAELAEAFVQGQAAKLVSASVAMSKSNDPRYKAAQEKRAADAKTALAALKSVPQAAALIGGPTEANARALVKAIAGKDLSGEVGALLPDPSTYK